jgi:enoyl-CoA hydratase
LPLSNQAKTGSYRVAGVPSDLQQINKRSAHRAFDAWGARAAIRAGTELAALAMQTDTARAFMTNALASAKEASAGTSPAE